MASNFQLRVLGALLAGALAVSIVGCNRTSDTSGLPAPSTPVGTVVDDSVVTTQVKSALLADPDVKSFDFKVETHKGEVQLSGFVDNQAQLDRALAVTRAVAGVTGVLNNVNLKGAQGSVGNTIDDGIVTTTVKAALISDAKVKSTDIAVTTHLGKVQLSGFVDNQEQIDRAIEVASAVAGVQSVSSELSLKK
jgi:hyperosmotically inducible protein